MGKRVSKIILDSTTEQREIVWDGERFALIHHLKMTNERRVDIFSPAEMMELIGFAGTLGKE